jgi:hypothetical protein
MDGKPYQERFPIGREVQIKNRDYLERFRLSWRLHHPLQLEQIDCARRITVVKKVSSYHGGEVLYELEHLPGIWHESCLEESAPEGNKNQE